MKMRGAEEIGMKSQHIKLPRLAKTKDKKRKIINKTVKKELICIGHILL